MTVRTLCAGQDYGKVLNANVKITGKRILLSWVKIKEYYYFIRVSWITAQNWHPHTQIPTHQHTHTYTYTHIYTCAHTRIHIHTHTHMHTHIHKCTHTYTHSHTEMHAEFCTDTLHKRPKIGSLRS
jgi:hypothetical protein